MAALLYRVIFIVVMPPLFRGHEIDTELGQKYISGVGDMQDWIYPGETCNIWVEIECPDSDENFRLGNFMAESSIYNSTSQIATRKRMVIK